MADAAEELKSVEEELDQVKQEFEKRAAQLQQKIRELKQLINDESMKKLANLNWEKDYPWTDKLNRTLRDVFKIASFRVKQLSAINASMAGYDVLLVTSAGGGKSLCYQLPALISEGITLVITPLVSLMDDQLASLETLNIKASQLSANSTKSEADEIQAMTDNQSDLKLLYVTPEKLARSKRFMSRLQKMYQSKHLTRIAIDEVHCCSRLGHDFKQDYKFLGVLRSSFPAVPIMGLTAAANSHVIDDIQKVLTLKRCLVFKAPFDRPNLYYEVRPKSAECIDELVELLQQRFAHQSGIIYTTSVKDCEQLVGELRQRQLRVAAYHPNLDTKQRTNVHDGWRTNKYQVLVATSAFGMGIDKPDVRFVIHHSISKSMENFYQESGRAGRDGQRSHCIVFWRLTDVFRLSANVFTEQTGLQKLYPMIEYCLEATKCRHQMIASHLEEELEPRCNQMCDHCSSLHPSDVETIPLLPHLDAILKILVRASQYDIRLTATKLIDALMSKGPTNLRLSENELPKSSHLSREMCETAIAYLLLRGYLKEDFHLTPYNTISYLVAGKNPDGEQPSMKIAAETANVAKPAIKKRHATDGHSSMKKKRRAEPIISH